MAKLLKIGVFATFLGMAFWLGTRLNLLIYSFASAPIANLTSSVITFLLVIAIKRGIWH